AGRQDSHALSAPIVPSTRLPFAFLRPSPLVLQGWLHPRLRRPHRPTIPLSRVPSHLLHADVPRRLPPQEASAQPRALRTLHLQGHAPPSRTSHRLLTLDGRAPT